MNCTIKKLFLLFLLMFLLLAGCSSDRAIYDSAIDLQTKNIGVSIGSGADIILSKTDNKLWRYDAAVEASFALGANKLDAIATEETTANNIILSNNAFKKLPEIIGFEDYCVVVSENSPIDILQINEYIEELILTEQYYDMCQKWITTDLKDKTLDSIDNNSTKEIIVGVNTEYVPFEYFGDEGIRSGFDIELIENMAKTFGYKVTYLEANFSSLFAAVKSNKVDLIISAIAKTDERAKYYNLSIPYYSNKIIYLANRISVLNGAIRKNRAERVYFSTRFLT